MGAHPENTRNVAHLVLRQIQKLDILVGHAATFTSSPYSKTRGFHAFGKLALPWMVNLVRSIGVMSAIRHDAAVVGN